MSLNSFQYFIFLPVVFLVFYVTKDMYRWVVLLVASYVFYATFNAPQLLAALILVTMISYSCGIRIVRSKENSQRKRIFWLGTIGCVVILASMKYLSPLLVLSGRKAVYSNLLIFIGVSYFTFQAISYMADIYLEIQEPEEHLGYHALYLAFFPKLLQGPIERAGCLLPQLRRSYDFDYNGVRYGLQLFAMGLFKKVVVADRLALFVNPIYGDVHSYTGIPLLLATYFYAIQIYCDFSGYTDMALGTARFFNINLTQNFNAPYFATSIADFWRRWHISFSRWILDYIFKPLQMAWRDQRNAGTALALIITFLICGIWHGSSWGFIVWGLLHGFYMSISVFYRPVQEKIFKIQKINNSKILKIGRILITFNMVCFAWIFFRANTISDGIYILSSIAKNVEYIFDFKYTRLQFRGLGLRESDLFMALAGIIIIFFINILEVKFGNIWQKLSSKPGWVRWAIYYVLLFSIIYFAPYNSAKNFIYMQF